MLHCSKGFLPIQMCVPKCVGSHDPKFFHRSKVFSSWPYLKSLLSLELPFPAAAGCELLPLAQGHPQGLEAAELAH